MRGLLNILVVTCFLASLGGCASFGRGLKDLLGSDTKKKRSRKSKKMRLDKVKNKKYSRANHKSLQDQSKLDAQSGSLWVERGQGAYLFTQNTNRLIGDLVNVNIEGHPKEQIETKVQVIENLIARIKEQKAQRKLASQAKQNANKPGQPAAPAKKAPPAAPKKAKGKTKFSVKTVPSRIVEIMKDGSYLVQGDQPFMLGKREYKLIVKGIVRQEDFDDQGISSETLLDPKFDIVTSKRKATRL